MEVVPSLYYRWKKETLRSSVVCQWAHSLKRGKQAWILESQALEIMLCGLHMLPLIAVTQ